MRAVAFGLACGLACGFVMVACGGQHPGVSWQAAQSKRNEITALWIEIRDWRHDAGMRVDPDDQTVMAMRAVPMSNVGKDCVLDKPRAKCADVCVLADDICENAESICEIARELGDDDWARGKCDSAKASCHEARENCCTCDRSALP